MHTKRSITGAIFLVVLFVLQSTSQIIHSNEKSLVLESQSDEVEWVRFDLRDDVYHDAVGVYDDTVSKETRPVHADTIIGIYDENGLNLARPIAVQYLEPRFDLSMLLISDQYNLLEARAAISDIAGLEIREYISPSGLIVQGTSYALRQASLLPHVSSFHDVPVALIIEPDLLDVLMLEGGEESLLGQRIRLEGWRGDNGLEASVSFSDGFNEIKQDFSSVVDLSLDNTIQWSTGRYEGDLINQNILEISLQPSLRSIRFNPVFEPDNSNSVGHMKSSSMKIYFTTDLDGSGQTVAVADSGLDDDHGDFGNRIIANNDVIGDGSTADKWSGHGTHVSCTVLGDGSRGGYTGVTPSAELYFQAMENDNTGNFQSPSLTQLLNNAYNAGARTHTNSWGNSGGFGQYNSESQDVDDRANTFDRYYSGGEGLTILFAAGNDGPNSDTISSPGTAKNVVTVGMHQNRYQGAPDTIMSGSSRGPVDDGRIKPDILAPGGYVRSCRAQEAADTGGASWSSTWYLEYTGTSMATPNAAGAAAMIREYLEEIALRDSPQGALVKALLILGAQDVGARDIPNMDEGWGRVNLRNSLAPPDGQGVWVDDRSLLSATGNSKTYEFEIDSGGDQFKAVLAWSDEYASTWSSTQLVNNLDLIITDPNGQTYLGNDFANGRSTTGGSADSVNNVEVVLIDSAIIGTWTVEVRDANHGGSRAQPFSIAIMGHGINDLKPDLVMVEEGFAIDIAIPSVGETTTLYSQIENTGNIRSDTFDVVLEVNGVIIETQSMDLGGGTNRELVWTWTPQVAGENILSFIIDLTGEIEETIENNNRQDVSINVSAPGVLVESANQIQTLIDADETSTSWDVAIQNTGLLPTNASIAENSVYMVETGEELNWYVGISASNFSLEGQESAQFSVTLVHPQTPEPGTYRVELLGIDLDNSVSQTYNLDMVVGEIANVDIEFAYDKLPVSPIETSTFSMYVNNLGNTEIAYDLQVQPPNGWNAYFVKDFTPGQFVTTELISVNGLEEIQLEITPPADVPSAGFETVLTISVWSKTSPALNWIIDVPIAVEAVKSVAINLDSGLNLIIPDSEFVMVFSIENNGNQLVDLSPTYLLPQGIEVVEGFGQVQLDISESKVLILKLSARQSAKTGLLTIHLDDATNRFTWSNTLDVRVNPEPVLEFTKLTYPDGTEYASNYYGSGDHPIGAQLTYEWQIGNLADVAWTPVILISPDPKLSVNCNDIDSLNLDEYETLTCTVFTSESLEPFEEPSFTINLEGNGAKFTEIVSLYMEGTEQITWTGLSSNSFVEGEEKTVSLLATNTGSLPFNYRVRAISDANWDVEIRGDGILDLEVGQADTVEVIIVPKSSGLSDISLIFDNLDNSDSNHVFTANADKKPGVAASLSNPATKVVLWIIGAVLIVVVAVVVFRPKKKEFMPIAQFSSMAGNGTMMAPIISQTTPTITPTITPPAVQTNPAAQPAAQNPLPICWICRKQIEGKAYGCPKCGARYHFEDGSDCHIGAIQECVSCQSPAKDFVEA